MDKGIRTLYPLGADGGANVTQPGVVALLGIALYVAGAGAASSLIGSLILKFGDQAARLAATPAPGAWTLVVDPAGLHRTALWHAWDTEQLERIAADQAAVASPFRGPPVTLSRCGRWSALTELGATIRAAELDQFSAYSRRDNQSSPPTASTPRTTCPTGCCTALRNDWGCCAGEGNAQLRTPERCPALELSTSLNPRAGTKT